MTLQQALAFAIIAGMMGLFVWDRIRYDLTALLGLLAALALGVVPPDRAFSGFSDPVVAIVAAALVVSAGVGKSGVISRFARRAGVHTTRTGVQVTTLGGAVAALSSFVKNIGALAIFLPVAMQIARRGGRSPSTLLMPMSFAALMGGLVTLIGTSPNILVSRVRQEITGQPFAMFDFAPVGLGILAAGLAFLSVGWRLLPRDRTAKTEAQDALKVDAYVTEALLPPESPFVNKTVAELEALSEGNVSVIGIVREGGRRYTPSGHWWMFANDLLLLQGDADSLKELAEDAGFVIAEEAKAAETENPAHLIAVEAVVMAGSALVGRTPTELMLRDRHGLNVIAIGRPDALGVSRINRTRFRVGDVLIVQGRSDGVMDVLAELGCLPLVERGGGLGSSGRDYLPLVVLAGTIAAIAAHLVPVAFAFLGAAAILILTRVLSLKEAYEAVDAPILVLLACLIPISEAITATGAAELLAARLAMVAELLPPTGALAIVLLAAMGVTPFLNNAATVLIMGPIAASIAGKLGLNADPFLMAVAIGAACDFLTPIGHQCNTLVMGPGGYRFGDYWRLGLPLSFIVALSGTLLIPVFWHF